MHLALQQLVKRHQSLSSTFPKPGEEPIQQINQHEKINFQQVDASTWNQAELQTKVYQESQRPFNLEQEKVMRVRLYTSSPTDHILLLTIHHIATDGWSLDIIISELAELYQAQQQGTTPSLPTIKYTYFDYVRSQQQMLAGTEGEKLWQYWQKQLQGELPVINLPTDKPRPPILTDQGKTKFFCNIFNEVEKKWIEKRFSPILQPIHNYETEKELEKVNPNRLPIICIHVRVS